MLNLRIKKRHLDNIRRGIKTVEYRSVKPYYTSRFVNGVSIIRFYCNGCRPVIVEVIRIKRIPTPEFLKKSDIKFTREVYAIYLKKE